MKYVQVKVKGASEPQWDIYTNGVLRGRVYKHGDTYYAMIRDGRVVARDCKTFHEAVKEIVGRVV